MFVDILETLVFWGVLRFVMNVNIYLLVTFSAIFT